MDFVSDTLENGWTIRVLTAVDSCSRLSTAIEVDATIAGERVTRVLERAGEWHGFPKTLSLARTAHPQVVPRRKSASLPVSRATSAPASAAR